MNSPISRIPFGRLHSFNNWEWHRRIQFETVCFSMLVLVSLYFIQIHIKIHPCTIPRYNYQLYLNKDRLICIFLPVNVSPNVFWALHYIFRFTVTLCGSWTLGCFSCMFPKCLSPESKDRLYAFEVEEFFCLHLLAFKIANIIMFTIRPLLLVPAEYTEVFWFNPTIWLLLKFPSVQSGI